MVKMGDKNKLLGPNTCCGRGFLMNQINIMSGNTTSETSKTKQTTKKERKRTEWRRWRASEQAGSSCCDCDEPGNCGARNDAEAPGKSDEMCDNEAAPGSSRRITGTGAIQSAPRDPPGDRRRRRQHASHKTAMNLSRRRPELARLDARPIKSIVVLAGPPLFPLLLLLPLLLQPTSVFRDLALELSNSPGNWPPHSTCHNRTGPSGTYCDSRPCDYPLAVGCRERGSKLPILVHLRPNNHKHCQAPDKPPPAPRFAQSMRRRNSPSQLAPDECPNHLKSSAFSRPGTGAGESGEHFAGSKWPLLIAEAALVTQQRPGDMAEWRPGGADLLGHVYGRRPPRHYRRPRQSDLPFPSSSSSASGPLVEPGLGSESETLAAAATLAHLLADQEPTGAASLPVDGRSRGGRGRGAALMLLIGAEPTESAMSRLPPRRHARRQQLKPRRSAAADSANSSGRPRRTTWTTNFMADYEPDSANQSSGAASAMIQSTGPASSQPSDSSAAAAAGAAEAPASGDERTVADLHKQTTFAFNDAYNNNDSNYDSDSNINNPRWSSIISGQQETRDSGNGNQLSEASNGNANGNANQDNAASRDRDREQTLPDWLEPSEPGNLSNMDNKLVDILDANGSNIQLVGNAANTCTEIATISEGLPSTSVRVVFFSLYGLIFAIGLVGNTLTLYAMRRKMDKSSTIDIFIANLALSDIMLCIFAVPITPIYMLYHGYWVFGLPLCKALTFAQGSSVYISTLTMISIAYVRYQLIVHPHNESMSRFFATILNLCTWVLGLLITLPYLMHVGLQPEQCTIKFCDEYWEKEINRFWFSVITLILQFFIPFIGVSFFYGSIFWKLRSQKQKRQLKRQEQQQLQFQRDSMDASAADSHQNQHQHQDTIAEDEMSAGEFHHGAGWLHRFRLHNFQRHANQPANHNVERELHSAIGIEAETICGQPSEMTLVQLRRNSQVLVAASGDATTTMATIGPRNGNGNNRGPRNEAELSVGGAAGRHNNNNNNCHRGRNSSVSIAAPATPQTNSAPTTAGSMKHHHHHLLGRHIHFGNNHHHHHHTRIIRNDILALKEQRQREKDKRLSRTNRKLVFMVVLFVFSWLPLNMFNLIQDYFETISESQYIKHVFIIVHLIACSSVCYNPILYAWMSDNYRQELQDILPMGLISKCCCLIPWGVAAATATPTTATTVAPTATTNSALIAHANETTDIDPGAAKQPITAASAPNVTDHLRGGALSRRTGR